MILRENSVLYSFEIIILRLDCSKIFQKLLKSGNCFSRSVLYFFCCKYAIEFTKTNVPVGCY